MRFHIGWRGERIIPYKGVKTSPEHTCFKNLERTPKHKAQIGQYVLVVGLNCYKWYQS